MSESDQATIPLRVSQETKPPGERSKEVREKMRIPRLTQIAIVSILVLLAGWGGWRYWDSIKQATDAESVTDIDGIELVTPLFDPDSQKEPESSRLSEPVINASRPKGRSGAAKGTDSNTASVNGSPRHGDVWLTGEIEVDDSIERVELPERISGGPNDTVIFR
jgi:hypothetical protein